MNSENFFSCDERRSLDLICLGRVAIDLYAEQIGSSLKHAQTFKKYLGGCAGNIAFGSARLGLKSAMLSCVGDDDLGQFLFDTLNEEGVNTKFLQRSPDHLTGLAILGVDPPDHFPLIFYRKDCADLNIDAEKVSDDFLQSAKALLFTGTGLSQTKSNLAHKNILSRAKKLGTKIIFDIDYRPVLWGQTKAGDGEDRESFSKNFHESIKEIISFCDLVIGTEEEIKAASAQKNLEPAKLFFLEHTNGPLVLKKGAAGCEIYFSKNQFFPCAALKIKVLNVLGAGDAFLSALLTKILQKQSFENAARYANASGALVATRHGCAPAIPCMAELELFLQTQNAQSKELDGLHDQIVVKKPRQHFFMPTLAFCHRWQLEEQCQKSGRPLSIIEPFKTALCEAALAAKTQNPKILLHILCDTEYGSQAIKLADKNHLPVIVAIEKSGEKLSQFVSDRSVYETLLARPKNWGVKFLWHFHVDQEKSFKKHQLKKLIELDHACKSLQRKLMLELILDSDHEISDEKYLASIKEVYECGVRPFWWKVSAFKSLKTWENFYALAKEYEPNPYALILGGSQKPLSDYAEDFFIAKSQKFGIGFAVGRSLFFESFKNYCEQKISLKDVSKNLTQPFLTLCDMWQKS